MAPSDRQSPGKGKNNLPEALEEKSINFKVDHFMEISSSVASIEVEKPTEFYSFDS